MLVKRCDQRIKAYRKKYLEIADKAWIKPDLERMTVYSSKKDTGYNLQSSQNTPLTFSMKRGIVNEKKGFLASGGLNINDLRQRELAQKHAEMFYEEIRKRKTDYIRIAENTGYTKEQIYSVKQYLFVEEHDLGDEHRAFYPSYEISESWRRLIEGKDIKQHDLTLLKHEILERSLVESGLNQYSAHIIASHKYNYKKEADEFYGTYE